MTLQISSANAVDMFIAQFDLKTASKIGADGISRAFDSWCTSVGIGSLSPTEKTQASALVVQRVMARQVAKGLNSYKPHANASKVCPTCGRG